MYVETPGSLGHLLAIVHELGDAGQGLICRVLALRREAEQQALLQDLLQFQVELRLHVIDVVDGLEDAPDCLHHALCGQVLVGLLVFWVSFVLDQSRESLGEFDAETLGVGSNLRAEDLDYLSERVDEVFEFDLIHDLQEHFQDVSEARTHEVTSSRVIEQSHGGLHCFNLHDHVRVLQMLEDSLSGGQQMVLLLEVEFAVPSVDPESASCQD